MQHYQPLNASPTADTPTFKTNTPRLVSNEGRVKRLLLLYNSLTLVFFGYNW